jgi:hypothetical protein
MKDGLSRRDHYLVHNCGQLAAFVVIQEFKYLNVLKEGGVTGHVASPCNQPAISEISVQDDRKVVYSHQEKRGNG